MRLLASGFYFLSFIEMLFHCICEGSRVEAMLLLPSVWPVVSFLALNAQAKEMNEFFTHDSCKRTNTIACGFHARLNLHNKKYCNAYKEGESNT